MSENTASAPSRSGLRPPWRPGQSGNPHGRPRTRQDIRDAISDEDGARVAAELVRLALHAKHESVRCAACTDILDRLHGRPAVSVMAAIAEVSPTDLDSLRVVLARRVEGLAVIQDHRVESPNGPEGEGSPLPASSPSQVVPR